ncbi:aminotransferase class I/II-fold pyridoxal phosphate-dependent enzyme [Ningiella sp. W23]|uniref:aminotransferase class I/II-fold pyridoxal phosphate-dependent enzyme n=1 Tax=Ningiella sp. W23 TaxID=3023715 RepID=UPI0037564779
MSNTQFDRRDFIKTALAGSAAVSLASLAIPAMARQEAHSSALHYGPMPGIAKLDANENPYGPSKAALSAIMKASQQGGAYYAYETGLRLIDMIAERYSLKPENVTLSSGSSGVLTSAALYASQTGKILGPDLFWDTTALAPHNQGKADILRLPKTNDLAIDLDAFYEAITDEVSMVQVTNPNNPTGRALDPVQLEKFCIKASKKCLVLVDEAYNELTDMPEKHSMIHLINKGHNIAVGRTFSKIYGLAGMRVGYLLSSADNIEKISKFGMGGYAMNQAGLAAAIASFDDNAFLTFSKEKIEQGREMVMSAVKANGLSALPSTTSFVFVNLGDVNADKFRAEMKAQNVMIRGVYRDYLSWSRVSMGKIEDVQKYVNALPRALDTLRNT